MGGSILDEHAEFWASLGIVVVGLLWGIYWIPLRALGEAGLPGPWATFVPAATATLILTPFVAVRWRRLVGGGWRLAAVGVCSGSAFVLYSDALLLTDVVAAILLFYLTPVWSTLLARVFLGQAITPARIVTIVVGIAGLVVILGAGERWPVPRNVGDWLGLVSGMAWALASVAIRKRSDVATLDNAFAFLAGGTAMAAAAPLVLMPGQVFVALPVGGAPATVAGLVVLIALAWFVGPLILLMWGARRLDPPSVGILLMGEVLVGVISAAILADEPFGLRQVAGGALIVAAAVIDIYTAGRARALRRTAAFDA